MMKEKAADHEIQQPVTAGMARIGSSTAVVNKSFLMCYSSLFSVGLPPGARVLHGTLI